MADIARGYDTLWALAKGSAWGTAVDILTAAIGGESAGANLIYCLDGSDTFKANKELDPNRSGTGSRLMLAPTRKTLGSSGGAASYMRYDDTPILLLLAMALGGTPTAALLTDAYTHTFTVGNSIDDLFFTFARQIQASTDQVHEFPSNAITTATLRGNASERMEFEWDTVGYGEETTDHGTPVNSVADFGSMTRLGTEDIILDNASTTFEMNDESGADVAGTGDIPIEGFEFSLNNNLDAIPTTGTAPNFAQSFATGGSEFTLTLTFPFFSSAADLALYTDFLDHVSKKCLFTFGGGLAIPAGTDNHSFKLFIPSMVLGEHNVNPENMGRVQPSATFVVNKATANPTGMSSTLPYIEVVYSNATALWT